MNATYGITAVVLVAVATLVIGTLGMRVSRTISDFFVASRSVRPALNASAIGGEYLSAASFLGIAGLILVHGAEMLWYPVGWTAGYLVLLVLVAAPLRRSGAYTLPDFAQARTDSLRVRGLSATLVMAIGWLYLMPQFQAASLTLTTVIGAADGVGAAVVALIVLVNVLAGGMRSITLVQACQYWFKLTALLVPLVFLALVWLDDGARSPADPGFVAGGQSGLAWADPLALAGGHPLYTTYSLMLATFLGTMGLPHVAVRFYTNPDGWAARRTTLAVLALLGLFYILPPVYGALGRLYASDLIGSGHSDVVVLDLPVTMIGGTLGDVLAALLVGGAFAAFLSTSSGLAIAVAGVLSQDVIMRRWGHRIGGVAAFRLAAGIAVLVALLLALLSRQASLATVVGMAFALAASTFCPLLVLGIWWPGLTARGAFAGLAVGGSVTITSIALALLGDLPPGWPRLFVEQPAAWTVPIAFATMVVVSLVRPETPSLRLRRFLVRLHTPEAIVLDRGTDRSSSTSDR